MAYKYLKIYFSWTCIKIANTQPLHSQHTYLHTIHLDIHMYADNADIVAAKQNMWLRQTASTTGCRRVAKASAANTLMQSGFCFLLFHMSCTHFFFIYFVLPLYLWYYRICKHAALLAIGNCQASAFFKVISRLLSCLLSCFVHFCNIALRYLYTHFHVAAFALRRRTCRQN